MKIDFKCEIKTTSRWQKVTVNKWVIATEPNHLNSWFIQERNIPCVPMCILSTLSALNSIENYYYHIEFRMDSMHIGTQASSCCSETQNSAVAVWNYFLSAKWSKNRQYGV